MWTSICNANWYQVFYLLATKERNETVILGPPDLHSFQAKVVHTRIVSSSDPTYERGSGDIWLIPRASLMLITFWIEISLRQSVVQHQKFLATPAPAQ